MAQRQHDLPASATESSPEEEERHADLVQAAKITELDAWRKFDAYEPRRNSSASIQIARTLCVLKREVADG